MRRHAQAAAGFTIMELMVVLAIISLIMAGSAVALRAVMRTNLRSAAGRVAATLRYVFDRATMTGSYMRVALDLDKGEVWIEQSTGAFSLKEGREQDVTDADKDKGQADEESATTEDEQAAAERRKQAKMSPLLGLFGAEAPAEGQDEEGQDGAEATFTPGIDVDLLRREVERDMRPVEKKKVTFTPLKNMVSRTLRLHKDVRIAAVITPRVVDPIEEGKAYIYFFPQGHAEAAIVHLLDKSDKGFSVVLHPLSGRARVYPCLYAVPAEFGISDDQKKSSRREVCKEDQL